MHRDYLIEPPSVMLLPLLRVLRDFPSSLASARAPGYCIEFAVGDAIISKLAEAP